MAKLNAKRCDSLDHLQRLYCAKVDEYAESTRLRYITPGAGQALVYQSKHADALKYLENSNGSFPWIEREALDTNRTMLQVAQEVITSQATWESVGVEIESARLDAKRQIRSAQTSGEMARIVSSFKDVLQPYWSN